MTNKPMLSVERELIQWLVDSEDLLDFGGRESELRALLDKPAPSPCQTLGCFGSAAEEWKHCETHKFYALREPAAQHQGESAACNHELTDDCEFLLVCTACGIQKDYTQALQLAFELGGTDDGSYHLEAEELCEVIRRYVEQPAPVAVVMPEQLIAAIEAEQERLSQEDYLMDSDECVEVIREEVARLNGMKM